MFEYMREYILGKFSSKLGYKGRNTGVYLACNIHGRKIKDYHTLTGLMLLYFYRNAYFLFQILLISFLGNI